MHFLIIGGRKFLGKHIVLQLLEKGHRITLFNRGKTNPDIFHDVECIQGDRNTELSKLRDIKADVVIDTCAYFPDQVANLLNTIKNNINHYILISSISVYKDYKINNIIEEYPVGKIKNEDTGEITGETYGPLKALCENKAFSLFQDVTVIRPGLICGPDDPSDRFSYWPVIMKKADKIIVPDSDDYIQFIDVRDLAEWTIHIAEKSINGIFNATGPSTPLKLHEFLNTCREMINPDIEIIFKDMDFISENDIHPWTDIPVWIPAEGDYLGFSRVSIEKAVRNGLTFRNYKETILDTLNWYRNSFDITEELKCGLKPDRINSLLEAEI